MGTARDRTNKETARVPVIVSPGCSFVSHKGHIYGAGQVALSSIEAINDSPDIIKEVCK